MDERQLQDIGELQTGMTLRHMVRGAGVAWHHGAVLDVWNRQSGRRHPIGRQRLAVSRPTR